MGSPKTPPITINHIPNPLSQKVSTCTFGDLEMFDHLGQKDVSLLYCLESAVKSCKEIASTGRHAHGEKRLKPFMSLAPGFWPRNLLVSSMLSWLVIPCIVCSDVTNTIGLLTSSRVCLTYVDMRSLSSTRIHVNVCSYKNTPLHRSQ